MQDDKAIRQLAADLEFYHVLQGSSAEFTARQTAAEKVRYLFEKTSSYLCASSNMELVDKVLTALSTAQKQIKDPRCLQVFYEAFSHISQRLPDLIENCEHYQRQEKEILEYLHVTDKQKYLADIMPFLDPDDRADVYQQVVMFMKRCEYVQPGITIILEHLQHIPKPNRAIMLDIAFGSGGKWENYPNVALAGNVNRDLASNINIYYPFYQIMFPLFPEGMQSEVIVRVIEFAEKHGIQAAKNGLLFIKKESSKYEATAMLREIQSIKGVNIEKIHVDMGSLSTKIQTLSLSAEDIKRIIVDVSDVPSNIRRSVCQKSVPLIQEGYKVFDIEFIMRSVCVAESVEPDKVYQQAVSLIKRPFSHGGQIWNVFAVVAGLPLDLREYICQKVEPLVQINFDSPYITALIQVLVSLGSREKIGALCDSAAPLFTPATEGNALTHLLLSIKDLLSDPRKEDIIACIVQVLGPVAREIYPEIVYEIAKQIVVESLQPRKTFSEAFSSAIENIMQSLAGKNLDTSINRIPFLLAKEKLQQWLQFFEDKGYTIGIDENSSVFLFGLRAYLTIQERLEGDEKNPNNIYYIHQKLLEEIQKPAFIYVEIGQHRYQADFSAIFVADEKDVTYAELPQVDKTIFESILTDLEKRISNPLLHLRIVEAIRPFIQGRGYAKIREIMTSPIERVHYWLNRSKPSDQTEQAPLYVIEMYALARFAQQLENVEDKDFAPLTQKEVFVLKMAYAIAECFSGEERGIHSSYQLLPSEYKIRPTTATSYVPPAHATLLEYLRPCMEQEKKEIARLLEQRGPFTEQIMEESAFTQMVHQTQYLYNLLFTDLSLPWTLKFDASSEVVDHSLRDRGKQEVLDIFVRHYPIQALIGRIHGYLNGVIKENRPLYNAIMEMTKGIPIEEVITLDEKSHPVLLFSGAIHILQRLKFLHAHSVK